MSLEVSGPAAPGASRPVVPSAALVLVHSMDGAAGSR